MFLQLNSVSYQRSPSPATLFLQQNRILWFLKSNYAYLTDVYTYLNTNWFFFIILPKFPWKNCGNSLFLPCVESMIQSSIVVFVFCNPYLHSFLLLQVKDHPMQWFRLFLSSWSLQGQIFLLWNFCISLWAIKAFSRACNATYCIAT